MRGVGGGKDVEADDDDDSDEVCFGKDTLRNLRQHEKNVTTMKIPQQDFTFVLLRDVRRGRGAEICVWRWRVAANTPALRWLPRATQAASPRLGFSGARFLATHKSDTGTGSGVHSLCHT
ncbi:hypothetical protein E2C01_006784 [Portunus trituberculatus]|uniref:Uncharacterized protein n=1 Tax=Portunus trituberculatus TaxID=210409 RepID=A0A5B7CYR8_PORTR|nr:hypothetical protein [Portunus trituberculatus]